MVCWCTGERKLALAIFFNNLSIFLFHGLSSVLWNRRTTTGVESAFCVENGLYRGRDKKFCIEYVRNANYNIQGVHSGGWIEQTGTLPGMNGQLALE